jgi:hypothetical protein
VYSDLYGYYPFIEGIEFDRIPGIILKNPSGLIL